MWRLIIAQNYVVKNKAKLYCEGDEFFLSKTNKLKKYLVNNIERHWEKRLIEKWSIGSYLTSFIFKNWGKILQWGFHITLNVMHAFNITRIFEKEENPVFCESRSFMQIIFHDFDIKSQGHVCIFNPCIMKQNLHCLWWK